MDPVEALRRSSGLATRAQLLALGVPRRGLESAVRDGELVRRGRGYTAPGAPPELVAAARAGAAVGCVSALAVRGVPVLAPARVHLLVASARYVHQVVLHRAERPSGVEDLVPAAGRAVRCLPRLEALVAADAVARLGVDTDLLRVAAGPRPGTAARWVLDHVEARAESPIESVLRGLVLDVGVREVVPQARIPGVGRVDLLVDGWLVLEADGFATHGTRTGFATDRERDAAAAALGLVTLRFTHPDLVHRPAAVTARLCAVLERPVGSADRRRRSPRRPRSTRKTA